MLDFSDCEPFEFQDDNWIRARKDHKCSACRELILKGDRYWRHVGKFDGRIETTKHCARCHAIWEHLSDKSDAGEGPDLQLDCGESYLDVFSEDPPVDIAAMAFMTRAEAQALAIPLEKK